MYELYDETSDDGVNVRIRAWKHGFYDVGGDISIDVRAVNGETGKIVHILTLRWC